MPYLSGMATVALTTRQTTVLQTIQHGEKMTARELGVRADVMWRLEERGLAARNAHEKWYILPAGREALAAELERLGI